ncbi:ATP-binding protein [Streptococcus oralis]|uniref:ATP-binding protein n=1 Tax=Streptococcus oralis TaxID=1303 RepID=UPI0020007079|nr:ATP-binding protein [Streptococcus oralis]
MIKNIFEVNSRGQPTSASVDINRFFAWIIAGPSGSGKSTFLRRLLGLISFYDTDAEAYFLDFKADEEMFSMTGNHIARGFNCLELFEIIYQRFEARLNKQEENSHNLYLIFDEWQAFLAYLEQTDKKKHKDVLSKMLMINSMGRSLGLRIILSSQRFLMSDLPGRYNFNCIISLSTSFLMSTNNRQLLFPDMEKDEVVIKPRGYGYFQLEGEPVKMFRTIQVRDEERLNQRMQELFSRYS